jgi:ribonuclease-3
MKRLQKLENIIGVSFNNKRLLINALVHRSYLNENKFLKVGSEQYYLTTPNEKLEFLGDSILSFVTSLYLYQKYPRLNEGDYTNIKAHIVRTQNLYRAAKVIQLGKFLYLSKGEEKNGGRSNPSILADAFEALIGAIFLDRGFKPTQQFIEKFLLGEVLAALVKNRVYSSAKNKLQEYLQNQYKKLPKYKVINESGPAHRREYIVAVLFNAEQIGVGIGKSKKEAEEQAAFAALKKLKITV